MVDSEAMWDALRHYGLNGKLLDVVKTLYRKANVCVKLKEMSEGFENTWGCEERMFSVFVDGAVMKRKEKVGNVAV